MGAVQRIYPNRARSIVLAPEVQRTNTTSDQTRTLATFGLSRRRAKYKIRLLGGGTSLAGGAILVDGIEALITPTADRAATKKQKLPCPPKKSKTTTQIPGSGKPTSAWRLRLSRPCVSKLNIKKRWMPLRPWFCSWPCVRKCPLDYDRLTCFAVSRSSWSRARREQHSRGDHGNTAKINTEPSKLSTQARAEDCFEKHNSRHVQ